ncbi:hypothetical protein [Nocardia sp. NPDC049149]|uniref:hypothetical protein n=1 Tax=Nocardia sp. NPDC049149 TaxID=3364315 RepID=UPI003720195C
MAEPIIYEAGSPRATFVSFDQAMTSALAIAMTSPSSHNCQPWAVARLVSNAARDHIATRIGALPTADQAATETLILAVDRTREIAALPTHHTEMRLSCGLFWHLLHRALAAQGWVACHHMHPDPAQLAGIGLPATWVPLRLTHFRWHPEPTETLGEVRTLAMRRQTNRGPYEDGPIAPILLDKLAENRTAAKRTRRGQRNRAGLPGVRNGTAQVDPTPQLHIRYLSSGPDLHRFAAFVARHAERDFTHRAAWRETHSYLRHSEAEAAAKGDGFTLTHLFGPLSARQRLLRRLMFTPAAMAVLSVTSFPRTIAGQLAGLVLRTPAIVSVSVSPWENADFDMVDAGALLGDYWLRVTGAGLAMHPISVVVQHDDLRYELQTEFQLPGRVVFVARLGRPTVRFLPAPRRPPAVLAL